ncbi:hypothetical protein PR002_g7904 [Phytophthora rubi]|uniref:Malonyl-CoA:ACP transacylase (MAT) domain-containing protein n=1 Tax=Phytophthora rubi TaxID=129364 RepID=A0A6A3N3E6_9STRA|nr:hypothetical protein PR002_g7904 [Phytophthora rubi]
MCNGTRCRCLEALPVVVEHVNFLPSRNAEGNASVAPAEKTDNKESVSPTSETGAPWPKTPEYDQNAATKAGEASVLDKASVAAEDGQDEVGSTEKPCEVQDESAEKALAQARARKEKCEQSGRPFTLPRGLATTPLVGIDVPFHSRELLGGVPSFRALLRTKFDPQVLERQLPLLVNRHIPNLVATLFSLESSYFEEVYQATKSPFLAEVLDTMHLQLTMKAQLAHLLVVELLAYQFAVPVQWIKTQALLFS